jgi:hypothetical protein
MRASASVGDDVLGAVFTPPRWARWAIERHGLVDAWLGGAVVLDPTAGDGSFIEAFIEGAVERGVAPSALPLHRLHGIERDRGFVERFHHRFHERWGLPFPRRGYVCDDALLAARQPVADILVGNPPWANFTDLPASYREQIKPLFHRHGLVGDARSLLLGRSRVDIAALIVAKAIRDNLRPRGRALFFLPLSIFLNDGAHEGFRSYEIAGTPFCVREIVDFDGNPIFEGIATRYGLVSIQRDAPQQFPVPFYVHRNGALVLQHARPLSTASGPLTIHGERGSDEPAAPRIRAGARPRQGVNTCGAGDLFIFDERAEAGPGLASMTNKRARGVRLPSKYLFPLISKSTFAEGAHRPQRWILLPHDEITGRPLSPAAVDACRPLREYLERHEGALSARKGTLIQSYVKRGLWWALFGVGPYCFSPYKVVWEACGARRLVVRVVGRDEEGRAWQGNQAMHAYFPCDDRASAEALRAQLASPAVEAYLASHRMEGTCNWAQPGRIARLLEDRGQEATTQFALPA